MSTQDKIERILKQIHVVLAEGEPDRTDSDKITVDKKEVLAVLEQLNLVIYEMMDEYEVTSQARELAERRSEKKGEEMVERISSQAEDVYAASLIYTDEALSHLQHLMTEAISSSEEIWRNFTLEMEQEKQRMKRDQSELREQLQDFKDSNKYLVMIEACNRERERERQDKEGKAPEKKIQNEAKHYAMNVKPEIKVNPAYFERRGIELPSETPEPEQSFTLPEIKVDLDAEYFKWQEKEKGTENKGDLELQIVKEETDILENSEAGTRGAARKEWKSLFGKKK